ncbi:hypothetical protein Mkiyose1665_28300 [Mycobacterium kiyosense]|uniref:Uncharacterized protein n=1 Tax=Mycobacterium kiyosense TaxID=2871094 RepID=A0A9P3Q5W9_9MYCO|nr:hypothetical protein IWGMT90018_17870 [Mycobacterium kiyosense]BDE13095.1 hypothetical protein MKCMC460_19550 [Mycobacterium sp. 20KCMC460]GLB82053.1 hypothetical protein SRL2020028_13090 [Mycobacterium kiyosense]GLB89564.1 hypothetical protein SRL2020130_23810 [Mycobacterium kiyosense]GLB95195.1 hypothetical protein SRL2020226_19710 [Mycobacterium kiyosense]
MDDVAVADALLEPVADVVEEDEAGAFSSLLPHAGANTLSATAAAKPTTAFAGFIRAPFYRWIWANYRARHG